MRVARRIKQRMYYALLIGKEPIYERDDNGNIIYRIHAGERIPVETGYFEDKYSDPIMFFNSISGQLTENELQAFGTQNMADAKMTYKRGQYPFRTGTLIWKQSEVGRDEDGEIDPSSADFRVMGVMNEGQLFWKAMMQAVSNNEH